MGSDKEVGVEAGDLITEPLTKEAEPPKEAETLEEAVKVGVAVDEGASNTGTSTDQKTKKKSSKKPDSKKTDVKKSKKASTIKGKMEEETEAAPAVEAEIKAETLAKEEESIKMQDGGNQLSEQEEVTLNGVPINGNVEQEKPEVVADDEAPSLETPAIETPAMEETPTVDNIPEAPAESATSTDETAEVPSETPVETAETPAAETSALETPAEETPSVPMEEVATVETPSETPAETPEATKTEETPVEDPPVLETPAETPAEESPVLVTPTKETPVVESSPDETPALVVSAPEETVPEKKNEETIPEMAPEPKPEEQLGKKKKLKKGKKVGKNKSEDVEVTTPQPVEAPAINGNHVIEESEVEKPPEAEIETLVLEEQPTNEISIETNGPTNEIPIETNGISEDPKDVEKVVEKEVDLTAINEDSTQTIGNSPKNILPPPETAAPYPSETSSKTNNQESVKAPISLPTSVKTATPTFNRNPEEVKPFANFETVAKKPVVLESNIGNTRIRDNGSNLALVTATEKTSMTSTASNRKISSNNVVGSQRKTLPEIKAGVSITYCEVFGSSRRRSIAQVMNYQSGHSGRNY